MTDAASAPDTRAPATSPVGLPRIGVAPVPTPAPPEADTTEVSTALLVDAMPRRTRRASDALDLIVTMIGLVAVLLLAAYGHQTTTGVTHDVQQALSPLMRKVLVLPLQTLEGLTTFLIPFVVLIGQVRRRSMWGGMQAALSSLLAWLLATASIAALSAWAPPALLFGLQPADNPAFQVGLSAVFAALCGLLTGAGDRRSVPSIRYSWYALATIVGFTVLRSALTLPGAVLSLLLGRASGMLVRYLLGVDDEAAHGLDFIRALRRSGIDAETVVRMDPAGEVCAWRVTSSAPLGYTEKVRESSRLSGPTETATAQHSSMVLDETVDVSAILARAASRALTEGRPSVHRMYAVWDTAGTRRDVTVIDADRQIAGFLATLWSRLRLKSDAWSNHKGLNLRTIAEHTALMTLEARRAQVRTPMLYGMAEADRSILIVTDHVTGARNLDERMAAADHATRISLLDQLWTQMSHAHAAGLAHRNLSSGTVVVDDSSRVWFLDWNMGETLSSEISRRMDLAQALALVATMVGVEDAIESASRTLSTEQLASIAPMLQSIILPEDTLEAMENSGDLLQELRDALVDLTPTAHAEMTNLRRFSWRTVLMVTVGVVALWTLAAQLNFQQVSEAVRGANPWLIALSVLFGFITYVGAGLTLVGFAPIRLGVARSTLVQVASSVVALVAPAGVGPAAINLRFLNRRGVPTPLGIATVALVQVVQFVITIILLVVLTAATGQSAGLDLPSGWVIVAAITLVSLVTLVLLIPPIRSWLWEKLEPTYRQVWPRLVWVMSNPRRLAVGVSGTLLLSVSYILCFGSSLWAFGYTLPISVLAITYLASNAVGSVVPSPGGIGPVELALTAGLVTAGIPSGVALSTAIVYRLVTFWLRIPVGWVSLQYLQKQGDL